MLEVLGSVAGKSKKLKESILVLDGYTGFTPIQQNVLEKILPLCEEMYVTVTIGEGERPYVQSDATNLFYLSKQTVSRLCQTASRVGCPVDDVKIKGNARFFHQPALAFLEQNLFRSKRNCYTERQDSIRVLECANPKEEMEYVSGMIHRMVRQKKMRWRDFAVITAWNICNIFRVPFILSIAGDMTAVCCLLMAAIFQSCILCGLIPVNSRYFELFQATGGLHAEITDNSFQRYYYSGEFPRLSREMRECIIAKSTVQEQGTQIRHIPVKGGHLFWAEDISVLLDQYLDIQEQQEELTARNHLLQKAYQKEAERRKTEEQNRLLNMIQSQTLRQYELLSTYMKSLEQAKTREEYDRILSKVVVVGTYLKRWKNLILSRYSSQEDELTMEDLKQSLAESCESLKLCKVRAAYFVQDKEKQLHADDVLKCYEFFEWLTEQLFDVVTSVFFRVTQIEKKLQISVHVVCACQEDIHIYLTERPELLIQQEEEQEWFIRCPVS